jgi:hypothetical protein
VPELADALDFLGPVHLDSSARYPMSRPAYELAGIAEDAAHAVIAAVEPLIRRT